MRTRSIIAVAGVLAITAIAVPSLAQQGRKNTKTTLEGAQEVPFVSTVAGGSLELAIGSESVDYTLAYADLEGSATQSHLHVGVPATNGGVSVWLCSNLASPPTPPGTPACPTTGGTVSGTFDASDVVGPAGQGIAAGEFGELIRAIRAGGVYGNVHSSKFPGGEIRGQISAPGA